MNGSNLITKLQAKHDLLKQTLGEGELGDGGPQEGLFSPLGHVVFPGASELFRIETLNPWQNRAWYWTHLPGLGSWGNWVQSGYRK